MELVENLELEGINKILKKLDFSPELGVLVINLKFLITVLPATISLGIFSDVGYWAIAIYKSSWKYLIEILPVVFSI